MEGTPEVCLSALTASATNVQNAAAYDVNLKVNVAVAAYVR